MSSSKSVTIGRWLLALYFIVPGVMKFAAWEDTVALMTLHNVPFEGPLVAVSAVVNIVGGLLLASNRFVRFTAFGFVLYIILVNALLHDFWNFPDELQNFIKNLGILAGLLVLAGVAPKRPLNPLGLTVSDQKYSG